MLAALVSAALAATPVAAPEPPPAVALMPLRSLGVAPDVAGALEETLRNELARIPEARLVPEEETQKELQAEQECETRVPCASQAALKAGAQRLIFVTASQLGDDFTIDLKLVDAKSARELRRATRPVSGPRDALIEHLREAAVELLAPTRYVGALQIDVPGAPGALVFIDGRPAGAAPLIRPIDGIAPGSHTVRVADAGSREVSTFVEVKYGRTTQARIDLGPERLVRAGNPQRPWLRPASYSVLALSAASIATGLMYQARAYSTAQDLNRRETVGQLVPGDQEGFRSIDRDTTRARWLYVSGAVLGALGAAGLWWDFRVAAGFDQVSVAKRF